MSCKNRWTISSSCDFHAHQQRAQRWYCFSQTALSLLLPGAPRLVVSAPRLFVGAPRLVVSAPRNVIGAPRLVAGAPRLVASASWRSQVHPKFSPVLQGVLKLITITPMVLLYQILKIPVTPKASRKAVLGSDTLLKLMHLSLHFIFSQTLLEACSN